jgi:hypothetical protein
VPIAERAEALKREHPEWSWAQVGAAVGATERQLRLYRRDLARLRDETAPG